MRAFCQENAAQTNNQLNGEYNHTKQTVDVVYSRKARGSIRGAHLLVHGGLN